MTRPDLVDQVVDAVLYEGYILYPYRPSAIKNRVRWTFGGIHPRTYSEEQGQTEPWQMRTECLVRPDGGCRLTVEVRFLHLLEHAEPGRAGWQEATERRFSIGDLDPHKLHTVPAQMPIRLPAQRETDGLTSREWQALEAMVEIRAQRVEAGADRVVVTIANTTPIPAKLDRETAMLHSLVSAHTILRLEKGAFVSLTDPPAELADAAADSHNLGTWPVLVGEEGATDALLSSPIILEDYPRIATESAGSLFDSTEVDELLTLRILSLTEAEKEEMRTSDERAARLLERTEALGAEDLIRMHGTVRDLHPVEEGR